MRRIGLTTMTGEYVTQEANLWIEEMRFCELEDIVIVSGYIIDHLHIK